MRAFSLLLEKAMGTKPWEALCSIAPNPSVPSPMTAIAEGAALAAGILSGEVEDHDFFVGTEHALGTVVHNQGPDKPEFSVLIPRNTKLPAEATDSYVPAGDNQEQVLVQIIEGDPEAPFTHEDNVILKAWEVQLEPLPRADAAFLVTFEYDVDGILHVKAHYQKTGKVILEIGRAHV